MIVGSMSFLIFPQAFTASAFETFFGYSFQKIAKASDIVF